MLSFHLRLWGLVTYLLAAAPTPQAPTTPTKSCRPDSSQGIEGTVYLIGGNRMPAPNRKPSALSGIQSTVYIYTLTNITQVDRAPGSAYYSAIHTKLVRKVDTDDKGYFKVLLPVGHYSIFTRKGDLYYASQRDDKNNIAPAEVLSHKMTLVKCSVESDHRPVY